MNLFLKSSLIAFIALTISSCHSDEPQLIEPAKSIQLSENEFMAGYANYDFSIKLLNELNKLDKGNNVISPLNIMINNGIFLNGTKGETQQELISAFDYDINITDYNAYVFNVCNALKTLDPISDYMNATALWIDNNKDLTLKSSFSNILKENYNVEIFNNYRLNTESSRDAINDWVSKNTNSRIPYILRETLTDKTKMFEVSALYFKGKWVTPFDRTKTKKETFTNEDGSSNEVDMMKADMELRAIKDEGYSAVKMPMGNKAYSLIVVLPDEGVSLEECTKHLTERNFRRFYNGKEESLVHISMPKFSIERSTDLKAAYEECGIRKMFTNIGKLNMFETTTNQYANESCMNNLKESISFSINEDGCEVASVVYSGLDAADAEMAPDGMIFNVNRPFIFMVKENSTPCPLILGTISYLSK